MSKKIIGIVSFMNAAGAQEALTRLMRQLRLRGHDTEVWFLYEKSPCYRNEPGTRVILEKPRLSALDIPRLFVRLVGMLRDARPDAVVGFLPLANIMGMSAAAAAGVDTRIASQRSPGPTFGRVMRTLDEFLGSHGVYGPIVCVSHAVRATFDSYPRRYRERLSVVNNGIEWVASGLQKVQARASFGIPDDYPLLVASGRFEPQKNYDLMVRVMATTPRLQLAIAGDGRLHATTVDLAKDLGADDRIHFLGGLPHARIKDFLRAADGFVQTSLFEGQSNSILEAMHEGLPIICSDIPMQRETLCEESGEPAAMLAPLDDFEAWREAFIRLRDDSAFSEDLGMRARSLVSRRFSLDRMIEGFETIILSRENSKWMLSGEARGVAHADYTH
jgi:glycosyltransferase involved in cell wall biosynthesis